MPDTEILSRATSDDRLVITMDKDFGELVHREGRTHASVLLLRLDDATGSEKARIVHEILKQRSDENSPAVSPFTKAGVSAFAAFTTRETASYRTEAPRTSSPYRAEIRSTRSVVRTRLLIYRRRILCHRAQRATSALRVPGPDAGRDVLRQGYGHRGQARAATAQCSKSPSRREPASELQCLRTGGSGHRHLIGSERCRSSGRRECAKSCRSELPRPADDDRQTHKTLVGDAGRRGRAHGPVASTRRESDRRLWQTARLS